MYIGELSRLTHATPRAIRLYESMGLIQVKRSGKYRVYDSSHVEFIQLIKEAQSLGVTLSELKDLKRGSNDLDWGALNGLLAAKRLELQQEMKQLKQHIKRVERYQHLISDCVERGLNQCELGA